MKYNRDSQTQIFKQGTAPITGLSETSSDSEDSERETNKNPDAFEILKIERVFITGALDELKIFFNYSHQVVWPIFLSWSLLSVDLAKNLTNVLLS